MSDERKAAIGFETCGCITFAMVLGYDTVKAEQREIARVIQEGRRVEIMDPDAAKALPNFMNCPHAHARVDDPKAEAERLLKEAGRG